MNAQRNRHWPVFLWLGVCAVLVSPSNGQDKPPIKPPVITPVTTTVIDGRIVTRIVIQLQNAPNNMMEPAAEPRRIQVDDRANVDLVLTNLSPFDVCTLGGRTPAPTAETSVAESLVSTIASLGSLGIPPGATNVTQQLLQSTTMLTEMMTIPKTSPACKVTNDPEYTKLVQFRDDFGTLAKQFIGKPDLARTCGKDDVIPAEQFDSTAEPGQPKFLSQADLSCQIDAASRSLAIYAAGDFRGTSQKDFSLAKAAVVNAKNWYAMSIPSVAGAGKLQALVDEMSNWASDLHKKYDFKVPGDGAAGVSLALPAAPVVTAAAQDLTFTYTDAGSTPDPQTLKVSSGGAAATFSVTVSPKDWISVSAPCLSSPPCRTGTSGTSNLVVTVDPSRLGGKSMDTTSITIAGTSGVTGSAIVNVTLKPAPSPTACDLDSLLEADKILDGAKAVMTLITANNTGLQTAQAAVKTNYMTLAKVSDDFTVRQKLGIVTVPGGIVVQEFNLGTDRKATITGTLSCVSDLDGKTPTTDAINFSILYQDVPHWSASAGLLTSFQRKRIIGFVDEPVTPATTPPTFNSYFGITDQARAQVIPMAFVNYRFTNYSFKYDKHMSYYGSTKESTLVWTGHITAGIGVNSNNGANQPEFFLGFALGLNRFLIHPGVHFGRMQSLGGGYALNTLAPTGVTPPIDWSYHPAFSIGFSVRLAPY